VAWLVRRWAYGGPAYLMVRVERQWLLFAGCHARIVRSGLDRGGLVDLSVWHTDVKGQGSWPRLRSWLIWDETGLEKDEAQRLKRLISAGEA